MFCPPYKKAVFKLKSLVGLAYINPLVARETTVLAITSYDWFCQLKRINIACIIKIYSFWHILCKKKKWLPMKYWPTDYFFITLLKGIALPPIKAVKVFQYYSSKNSPYSSQTLWRKFLRCISQNGQKKKKIYILFSYRQKTKEHTLSEKPEISTCI